MGGLDFIFWVLVIGIIIYILCSFFSLVMMRQRFVRERSILVKMDFCRSSKISRLKDLCKMGLWETVEFKWEPRLVLTLAGRLILIEGERKWKS